MGSTGTGTDGLLDTGTGHRLPSCESCRHRKLKCSREQPECSGCRRLGAPCIYDQRRSKPGLKSGAVESLARRIDTLERLCLCGEFSNGSASSSASRELPERPQGEEPPGSSRERPTTPPSIIGVLSILSEEIRNLRSSIVELPKLTSGQSSNSSTSPHLHGSGAYITRNGKRQRLGVNILNTMEPEPESGLEDRGRSSQDLFTGQICEKLVTAYFTHVHPWIPMIHEGTFRRKLHQSNRQRPPLILLHAMVFGALRLLDTKEAALQSRCVQYEVERSRRFVILEATDNLSVENLQALVITAFTDLGNGEPHRAWTIVGSLIRTVEYLQLSIEEQDRKAPTRFLTPKALPKPTNWLEEEERRRVFWNIFILDRLCSVITGWGIGLTAENVSRRLPICGSRWNAKSAAMSAMSPYLGIWGKPAAKIGNPIPCFPAQYSSPGKSMEESVPDCEITMTINQQRCEAQGSMDMSRVGAFAYYVESLESLCRIDMYFLRQKIDFNDRREVSSWLTRFKELDLHLIHWKISLPQKWQDPEVPPDEIAPALDPNMSLAHVTHNTSMILLHQRIGYPKSELKSLNLPNFYSAETCQSAAIEICNITRKYLALSPHTVPISPHFSFCIFISAKVLLVHSRYYGVDLAPQFAILVECLENISRRWGFDGKEVGRPATSPLSQQFAVRLRKLYDQIQNYPNFEIVDLDSLDDDSSDESGPAQQQEHQDSPQAYQFAPYPFTKPSQPPPFSSDAFGVVPPGNDGSSIPGPDKGLIANSSSATNNEQQSQTNESGPKGRILPSKTREVFMPGSDATGMPDELPDILQSLTDQQYMEMDRVISFDDFQFTPFTSQLADVPPSGENR